MIEKIKIKFIYKHRRYEGIFSVNFDRIDHSLNPEIAEDLIINNISVLGMINDECILSYPDEGMSLLIRELIFNELTCITTNKGE